MFEALLLIAIIAYLAHLGRRVTRLERQRDEWQAPQQYWTPAPASDGPAEAWEVPAAAETIAPIEEPPIVEVEGPQEPVAAELEPVLETAEEETSGGFGFEELFGRRLPIWAGGITLAVAGMLIVKLSIEAGLLSPPVRVIMGTIFGFVLIGAAELALRQEERVRDERVRQALAGAGIASLYASILVAANLYHLVGPLMAMLGMAAVTALALGLSLRFGAPSALLGLAGGLAAPALIGSDEPNVPLLSLYLALAVGGLTTVSRGQRWAWLGISALVGGFGWGLLLMLGGALSMPDTISVALYLLLLGVALPMLGFAGGWQDRLRLIAAVAAAAQMAALVATGGFAMLNWGLFGLISLALLWLASREPSLDRLPPVGLVIALMLLVAWPDPGLRNYALVAVGAAVIYGAPALLRLWREKGGLIEAGELSAIAVGSQFIAMFHFYRADGSSDAEFGLLAVSLASLAAASVAIGWRNAGRRDDARFAILATSSALLFATAASLVLPEWAVGPAIGIIGFGLLNLGQAADDRRLEPVSWIFASAGLMASVSSISGARSNWQEVASWGSLAAIAASFAWRASFRYGRIAAQFIAPILLVGALQPIVPERWEPLIAPAMLVGLAAAPVRLVPAMASATLLLIGWALLPGGTWLATASESLAGTPMLVTGVAPVEDLLVKLLIPSLLLGLAAWLARTRLERRELIIGSSIAAVIATVAIHSLYKQLFAIGSADAFVAYGLAERTLWEAMLIGGAAALWRIGHQRPGAILLGAGFAHFTLYTLLLHNPLWASQAVGPLPILNLIPLAYAVPLAAMQVAGRQTSLRDLLSDRTFTIASMSLILLFAASMLRQLFHGSLLVEPGLSQAEDIARSILAIALAIGFLLWGIRTQQRDWRIGSLVLMLAAVAKVFLWDTQGLEGLIRIASFVALGFSLIGIGWLYSRQLAPSKA